MKLGEGNEVFFWNENWLGLGILKDKYERLYNLSTQQDCCIKELGELEVEILVNRNKVLGGSPAAASYRT